MKLSIPMQRLLNLLAEADATKPPSVQVPQKFVDEWNRFGEIRSREEYLEHIKTELIKHE